MGISSETYTEKKLVGLGGITKQNLTYGNYWESSTSDCLLSYFHLITCFFLISRILFEILINFIIN